MAKWIPSLAAGPGSWDSYNGVTTLTNCINDDPQSPDSAYVKKTSGVSTPQLEVYFPSTAEAITQAVVRIYTNFDLAKNITLTLRDMSTLNDYFQTINYPIPAGPAYTEITLGTLISGHAFGNPRLLIYSVLTSFDNYFIYAVNLITNGNDGSVAPSSVGPFDTGLDGLPKEEITPFHCPDFRFGFNDGRAKVLLPLNEGSGDVINHYARKATITKSGVSLAANYIACAYDAGLSKFASRTGGTSLVNALYTARTNYLGNRLSIMALDGIPLFQGQTCAVADFTFQDRYASGSGSITQNTIYGVKGNPAWPTTVAELDALTLTTASVTFLPDVSSPTVVGDRTVNLATIIAEIVAESTWQFGDPIYLVIVNSASQNVVADGEVGLRYYLALTPNNPSSYRPVTPNGPAYNIGGYAAGHTPISSGDLIDYDYIRYSGATAIGDNVAQYLAVQPNPGNEYVEYLDTTFTATWQFDNVISPINVPDFVDLSLEMEMNGASGPLANNAVYFNKVQVLDAANNVIGEIHGPQWTYTQEYDRQIKIFRIPLAKRLLNPLYFSHLTIKMTSLKRGFAPDTIVGSVQLYSVGLRPVFGQRGKLTLTGVDAGTGLGLLKNFTCAFWFYSPFKTYGRVGPCTITGDVLGEDSTAGTELLNTRPDHYIITHNVNDNLVRIYRNGELLAGYAMISIPVTYANMDIGPIQGAIADFRVYDSIESVLSNAQYLMRMPAFPDPRKIETAVTPVFADPLIMLLGL